MLNSYTLVSQLTSPHFAFATSRRMLNDFAEQFGWRPSDHLDVPSLRQIANAHLLVERGLENSAVISFLQRPWASLGYIERQ